MMGHRQVEQAALFYEPQGLAQPSIDLDYGAGAERGQAAFASTMARAKQLVAMIRMIAFVTEHVLPHWHAEPANETPDDRGWSRLRGSYPSRGVRDRVAAISFGSNLRDPSAPSQLPLIRLECDPRVPERGLIPNRLELGIANPPRHTAMRGHLRGDARKGIKTQPAVYVYNITQQ